MKAEARTLQDILNASVQFIIPLFQRYYSWRPEDWTRLREDIWALLDADGSRVHFLGPMVCTGTGPTPGHVPCFQLIDGQQRLTTLTVLLAALRDVARSRGIDDLANEVRDCYLINIHKKEAERYKLVPRLGDRQALTDIIEGGAHKVDASKTLAEVYHYLLRRVDHLARRDAESQLRRLFAVVTGCVHLVVITIDGENPYEIFESLNSTGLPLEEADLIRNFVFMHVPLSGQEGFHSKHWDPFEESFADSSGNVSAKELTDFFRCYLMRSGKYLGRDTVFPEFKAQYSTRGLTPEQVVEELCDYAGLFLQMRTPQLCSDADLRALLEQVIDLDAGTASPLILNLMHRHKHGRLFRGDLIACIKDLCSFMIRRLVCGETTAPYNKWFTDAVPAMGSEPAEALHDLWVRRGWPDDESFVEGLLTFPIYSRYLRVAGMLLQTLERDLSSKEMIITEGLTIEHVMPQTMRDDEPGVAWRQMLGENWEHEHAILLHTLGNLTLTGYNSELGNQAFAEKKRLLNAKGKLLLNEAIKDADIWDGDAIRERGRQLGARLATLWSRPPGAGAYPPPSRKRIQAEGLKPIQRTRLAYWQALRESLQAEGRDDQLPEAEPGTNCWFPIDLPGAETGIVRLWAWMYQGKRILKVGMSFERPGKHVWEKLRGKHAEIDKELGRDVTWYSHGLSVATEDVAFGDRGDWEIQHAWIADRVDDFHRVVLQRIDPADFASVEQEGYRKRFWTDFVGLLKQRHFREANIPSPPRDNWISFSVGQGGTCFSTVISTWDTTDSGAGGELRVEFCFSHDRAGIWFARLKEGSQNLESEIGQPLHWYEAEGVKTRRVFVRLCANPLDVERWPEYWQWLADNLTAFYQVFRPRIAELP